MKKIKFTQLNLRSNYLTGLIIPILVLVSLAGAVPLSAGAEKTLSEDIFPQTLWGLPLYGLEEIEPEADLAEGFFAYYGTEDSISDITIFFGRIIGRDSLRTAKEDFIAGFEEELYAVFDYLEKEGPNQVEVKGQSATILNYQLYSGEESFSVGLIMAVVNDYFIAVQIADYQGIKPSSVDLKDILGFFIEKVPGQKEEQKPEEQPAQNLFPELEISFSEKNVNLELGGSAALKMTIKNTGQAEAEGIYYTVLVDKPEVADVYPLKGTIGNLNPDEEFSDYLGIAVKGSGKAYLAIHFRGDNIASIMKFIQVSVPESVGLSVPESLFLLPGQTEEIGLILGNFGSKPVFVRAISLTSSDPSVVSIEEGSQMQVFGQGQGIKQDEIFTTESQDITRSISPKPKIKALAVGETELVFKVLYDAKSLEKKVKVAVGEPLGGKNPALEMELEPRGLTLERDEARKVEVFLVNTGSEIIREGKIYISKSNEAPFEATREISFGFIRPGKEVKAEIEVIGHSQFPAGLQGDVAVTGTLTFQGQFITLDGKKFDFNDQMKVSLVSQRARCSAENSQCSETVECFAALSNEMGCALEFADLVPYFDKPVAAVLATSDACEIKDRVDSGDSIGAAVSALLMAVDLGDNAADAVPGAGNVLGVLCDIAEGSADCLEGFIYDAVNDYCAGGQGGYSGCAQRLFDLIAQESGQWKEPKSAVHSVVAIGGSPISLRVADDDEKELTLADGVLLIEKQGLNLIFIKNPEELTNGYNFRIRGIGRGKYNLNLGLISDGRLVETTELKDQPIDLDQTVEIPLAVEVKKDKLTGLFVGDQAEQFKQEQKKSTEKEKQGFVLYIVIGSLAGVALIAGAGFVVWFIIKKKKKIRNK